MKFEEKFEGTGSLVEKCQPYLDQIHQANGKPVANGKAEAYVRQEVNGKSNVFNKSLNTYTWEEIQRHNQEADQWLVIDHKVYNVTDWADKHPGGHRVLNHYAGEDATVRTSKPFSHSLSLSLNLPPSLPSSLFLALPLALFPLNSPPPLPPSLPSSPSANS
jgi:hypothetical protein